MNKFLMAILLIGSTLFLLSNHANAQAIYDSKGQYKGYAQTSPSGVTNLYNTTGRNVGSYQVDNGQTNFYSPQGAYQGTITSPTYSFPNTTIDSPRNVPQAKSIGGW